jgi:hypothetical protein
LRRRLFGGDMNLKYVVLASAVLLSHAACAQTTRIQPNTDPLAMAQEQLILQRYEALRLARNPNYRFWYHNEADKMADRVVELNLKIYQIQQLRKQQKQQ